MTSAGHALLNSRSEFTYEVGTMGRSLAILALLWGQIFKGPVAT